MYTVKDLIETLKQCSEDYPVKWYSLESGFELDIETVGIDHDEKTVVLFS